MGDDSRQRGDTSREPEDRPEVDIDRGEGRTPAMNVEGPKKESDAEVVPGNLGWDEPSQEQQETLEGAVRRATSPQTGESARLPSEAAGAD